jgi:hypothetical protein
MGEMDELIERACQVSSVADTFAEIREAARRAVEGA